MATSSRDSKVETRSGLTTLTMDSSCCNRLNWGCRLVGQADSAVLEPWLVTRGFTNRCRYAGLHVFRHSQGHEVTWVETTGRVQIRVDIAQPAARRKRVAEQLYDLLSRGFESAAKSTGGDTDHLNEGLR